MLEVFRKLARDKKLALLFSINTHVHWNPVCHHAQYLGDLVFNKVARFESYYCLLHFIPQALFFLHFLYGFL